MAKKAVEKRNISIRLVCSAFAISETCYRYQAKLSDENIKIADWLIRLTHNHRNWGFGLCFLYLRNVKDFRWKRKIDLYAQTFTVEIVNNIKCPVTTSIGKLVMHEVH